MNSAERRSFQVGVVLGFALTVLALLLTNCGPSSQVTIANAVAIGIDGADLTLGQAFRADVATCTTLTGAERDACIDGVVDRFRPAIVAVEAVAVAHDQWADALEAGGSVDVAELLAAYCGLREPLEAVGVGLPDGGVLCQ